ncbi:hypothetical protein QJS04_geneDACA003936 [Acorus gramineus]|uniref:Uncharacterized protein n=1 Tax=Acorus gramineus TaxID=55184 RepID=A0AAV9BFS8_ACOGR|nr:hypothetical protein QJS04_geneDACA003936 [Acorus gramineus]
MSTTRPNGGGGIYIDDGCFSRSGDEGGGSGICRGDPIGLGLVPNRDVDGVVFFPGRSSLVMWTYFDGNRTWFMGH